jgi:hypothetical protein
VGANQTVVVTTTANSWVTMVMTFPDSSQVVVGPKRAGSNGHLTYTWKIPAGQHGIVRLVVVGASVAQGSFTVS